MKAQWTNFLQSTSGADELWMTTEDAFESVRVIEAAYRSISKMHWQELASV